MDYDKLSTLYCNRTLIEASNIELYYEIHELNKHKRNI